MAFLRCDNCGSSDTNTFGSWDTPITILCKKCSEEIIVLGLIEESWKR